MSDNPPPPPGADPPPGAYPPPPPPPYGAPPPPPPPGPSSEPPKHPYRLRTRDKVIAGSLGGLVLAGAIAAAVAGGGDGDETTTVEETTAEPAENESAQPETTEAPATTITAAPTTTLPEGPQTLPMGETLTFTVTDFADQQTDVEVVVANPITADREPAEYGMEPSRGLFLVVDVSVRAVSGEGTYSASPYEFKFVAADGSVAEQTYVGEGFGTELPYSDLSAGQQIAGKVGFDIVPGQEVGGRIQINDSGENYGEPFAYWAL